jgi:hypothetical protein
VKPVIEGQTASDVRQQTSKVGCPIRKSADQSLFAAPHGLSQRTTSFIACACQGIHRTPLLHLIALIIDVRPLRRPIQPERGTSDIPRAPQRVAPSSTPSKNEEDADRPPSRQPIRPAPPKRNRSWKDQCHTRTARRRGGHASSAFARPPRLAVGSVRTTLLFTMSVNRQRIPNGPLQSCLSSDKLSPASLVEPDGIEPTTSCLQSRRSPN